MEIVFSDHALFEMKRRQIDKEIVNDVFENPHQKFSSKKGRVVIQRKYLNQHQGREMLLRIIGKEKEDVFYIITIYKTSKIEKYWIKEA
jgi:hypothetical protein